LAGRRKAYLSKQKHVEASQKAKATRRLKQDKKRLYVNNGNGKVKNGGFVTTALRLLLTGGSWYFDMKRGGNMEMALPLDQMTITEKLHALEEIWESLCRAPANLPSPAWHADVLRARENRVQQGSSKFNDWTEAKKKIRDSAK
jgi:hypothetical protein